MKKIFLYIVFILIYQSAIGQNYIKGTLKDYKTDDFIIGASVGLYQNGEIIKWGLTDFDGLYLLSNVEPGNYKLRATYIGYKLQEKEIIMLKNIQIHNFRMKEKVLGTNEFPICFTFYFPMINIAGGSTEFTYKRENIRRMPY